MTGLMNVPTVTPFARLLVDMADRFMDIAEIRKKAKAQNKPDEFVLDPAPQDETLPESESSAGSDGSVEGAGTQEAASSYVMDLGTSASGLSALDQLFAVTDEFALAAESSCSDNLESSVDTREQTNRQYLAFNLGDEEYALDIKRISEIIKVREFTDVPRAPGFVLGIISLRGVVVPVFDLRCRLNLGMSEMLPTSRIVVCQLEDVSVGLLVDSINQVVKMFDDEVEPPPGVLSALDREMVGGLGRYQGRMIILLNIHSVLDVASL